MPCVGIHIGMTKLFRGGQGFCFFDCHITNADTVPGTGRIRKYLMIECQKVSEPFA